MPLHYLSVVQCVFLRAHGGWAHGGGGNLHPFPQVFNRAYNICKAIKAQASASAKAW